MVVQAQVLTFEQFEIRLRERVLLVQGERVSLGGKAFDVLVALAERCDRVVSKAELLDLAWPGVVVEEPDLEFMLSRAQLDCLKAKLEDPAIDLDPSAKIDLASCG